MLVPMRLFASLRPSDAALEHLARALTSVHLGARPFDGSGAPPVRWSAPESWHVTLAFYGDVPDGAVPELEDGLADLAAHHEPFDLRLQGAGVFAHRTLWVGLGGDAAAVVGLCAGARDVGAAVLGRAEARERARPHLTVGRVTDEVRAGRSRRRGGRGGRGAGRAAGVDPLAAPVRALGVYEGPSWTVDAVRLVRSDLGQGRGGAALHTDVARLRLGARP